MTVKEVLYQREIWMLIQYHTVALQGKMAIMVIQYLRLIYDRRRTWLVRGRCMEQSRFNYHLIIYGYF